MLAEEIFTITMAMIDEMNSNATLDEDSVSEYRAKAPFILTMLQNEIVGIENRYKRKKEYIYPVPIVDLNQTVQVDDIKANTLLTNGLAANLMMHEDTELASFFEQRYEEMKANEDCIKVVTEDSVHKVSFRKFLELLGTQGIRKYDNDFWCRALIKTLKDKQYKKVCISDMRFINEYTYLKKFAEENDYMFKVLFCNYRSDRYQDNNTHESAKLANYFCTHGYTDLQEITDDDMQQAFEKFTKVLV